MGDIVIKAEGLGKKYLIGRKAETRDESFAHHAMQSIRSMASSVGKMVSGKQIVSGDFLEEFWALRELNFEVARGDVVGIIGRNGAGKSTLLKLLSRITEPSEGRLSIQGRVASLLEVGTGFHPELSGRENIYLNGAILGMTRQEIRSRFDEIVEFAEIDKFLDTPVKRYSSGMYVRLAFAVAAHLEPEVLVVDEVLAVGDLAFQKKCLGKMNDVASDGRTVIFVSHNTDIVAELCKSGIYLKSGQIVGMGGINDVINDYLCVSTSGVQYLSHSETGYDIELKLSEDSRAFVPKNESIDIHLKISASINHPTLHVGYALYRRSDHVALWWSFFGDKTGQLGVQKGESRFETKIPANLLNDGEYEIELLVADHGTGWLLPPEGSPQRAVFEVRGGTMGSTLVSGTTRPGRLLPILEWEKCTSW